MVERSLAPFEILEQIGADSTDLFGDGYEFAEADVAAMSDDAVACELRRTLTEALRQGADGWVNDDLAFVTPWGFDPSARSRRRSSCYGDADTRVPAAHGRWLAATIPGATEQRDEVGHIGTLDPDEIARQFTWLAGD
jgi:hypothetical protein